MCKLKYLVAFSPGEWVKDSLITLSEKPGIGVEINEEGMKKNTIPKISFLNHE